MTLTGVRNGITFVIVGLYLILNWGFMLVRFPPDPGSGVPIAEIWLVFLLFMVLDYRWLPRFVDTPLILPLALWWAFGIGSALYAVPNHGWWALRDATHVIESLFLWVGFVFAANSDTIDRLFVSFRRLLIFGTLYGFTFPWREEIQDASPTIQAAAGYTAPLIGYYVTTPTLLILEAARRIIWIKVDGVIASLLVPGLLVFYAVAFFQARTVYLQVLAIFLLLSWQRRAAFGQISLALTMAALLFLVLAASGVEILGRREEPLSIEFVIKHFAAIWGRSAPGVEGAAAGVFQRFDWWGTIWRQLTDDPMKLLFGLGFGRPLIDFLGPESVIVREPHNSYISILGRMGLFGTAIFTWAHVVLLKTWLRAYALSRREGLREEQNRLLLFMSYFVLIWVFSLGEDALEKPFNTVPYYFFWGIVLHYERHLRLRWAA